MDGVCTSDVSPRESSNLDRYVFRWIHDMCVCVCVCQGIGCSGLPQAQRTDGSVQFKVDFCEMGFHQCLHHKHPYPAEQAGRWACNGRAQAITHLSYAHCAIMHPTLHWLGATRPVIIMVDTRSTLVRIKN
eukprot:500092-Pelagomonas_calceolata.AAC.11